MPIRLGDLSAILTPYTPPGGSGPSFSRALRSAVRGTEIFAKSQADQRAAEERAKKFQLEKAKFAEQQRRHLELEVHARDTLDETKRSAVQREKDQALTTKRLNQKQATELFKGADAAYSQGAVQTGRILLSIAGFPVDELQTDAEVGAAIQGLGEAVSSGEQKAIQEGEPGELFTKEEKLQKLGLQDPFPAGPTLDVPRETSAVPGAAAPPPVGVPAPPVLPQAGKLLAPPGAPPPAYDPSQVPIGGAPAGMSRDDFLAAERAQEPAFAQQPALPALPGQMPVGQMPPPGKSPIAKAGENIAAATLDEGMQITTPEGDTFAYNPLARNEQARITAKNYFQRYMEGADPIDVPAAEQVQDLVQDTMQMFAGDKKGALQHLEKILARKETVAHADERAKIMAAAKRAERDSQGPDYDRRYLAARRVVREDATKQGFFRDTSSLDGLRKAENLLKVTGKEAGYAHGRAITMIQRSMEKGVATDADINRAKFGYMSLSAKIKGWLTEKKDGRLEPAHIEAISRSILHLRVATLKHMQQIRNTLDRDGDSVPEGAISKAYRDWTDSNFTPFKIKRQQTQEEELADAKQQAQHGTPLDPRIHRIPDREEVRMQADMLERGQGADAKKKFLEEQGVEDVGSAIGDLIQEGVGVAP